MASFHNVVAQRFLLKELHLYQSQALDALLSNQDVFIASKTGSGKSLTFQGFPVAWQWKSCEEDREMPASGSSTAAAISSSPCMVIIITPLLSIMKEQVAALQALGFTSTYIGKDEAEREAITSGTFQFLFASPESIIGNERWRSMLRSPVFGEKVKLLVTDEAHTMIDWGEGQESDRPFREWFSRIGELRSLFPGCPMLALTATASNGTRRKIKQKLGMVNPFEIVDCPDRSNIKLFVKKIPSMEPLEQTFSSIIADLNEKKGDCSRFVIFCKSIQECSRLFYLFRTELPPVCHSLFDMFHSQTLEHIKDRIRADMATKTGSIRVLICTNAAGMGVNFRGVCHIINFGPPHDMDTFIQQIGRAGREGEQSYHALIYSNRHLIHISSELIDYIKSEGCRRDALVKAYSGSKGEMVNHLCCDYCQSKCKCPDDCSRSHLHPVLIDKCDSDTETDVMLDVRTFTQTQKMDLRKEIFDYRSTLDEDKVHALSETCIRLIIENCSKIDNVDTLMDMCKLWYFEQGVHIMKLIADVAEES